MQTEILKKKLLEIISVINKAKGNEKLKFHQQKVEKKHMSLSGGNGRIWITPSPIGYDVSLSGRSIEKELYPQLKRVFGRVHDGYKQTDRQPYWRTDNFSMVKQAAELYSETIDSIIDSFEIGRVY